jgi:transcriptional regulator with XRE-family HTH domain
MAAKKSPPKQPLAKGVASKRQPARAAARPSTVSAAPSTAPRSEGHRLLAKLTASGPDIAKAAGVSRQVVAEWRAGRKVPGAHARENLEARFRIPASAWDSTPGVAIDGKPAAARSREEPAAAIAVEDGLEDSIRECRQSAADETLRAEVRVRYQAELNKLLIARAKMRDDQRAAERAREQKLTRHPRSVRIFATLFEAIAAWPDALRAQQEALERLRAEEDAT